MFDLVLGLRGLYDKHVIIFGDFLPGSEINRVRGIYTDGEYLVIQRWDYKFDRIYKDGGWVYDVTDNKLIYGSLPTGDMDA